MAIRIQLRRGTSAEWTAINPILADGEPGLETDTNKLKLGDGVTEWDSLGYLTQDFINIVSSGGIDDLTIEQQNQIVEGTIVLTDDGGRWIYTGSGDKSLEASYIQLADISPAWVQITNVPASLLGLADISSTATGDFILASGNNIYQAVSFAESVDDRVGSLVIQGSGIRVTYNDEPDDQLVIAVSGLNSTYISDFDEAVQDNLNTSLVEGSFIDLDYNDPGGTLTVNVLTDTDSTANTIVERDSVGDIYANFYFGDFDGPVVYDCRNNTASTINKGTPVYISGHFANGKVDVEPADASNSAKMPALGLLGETLTPAQEGHVHMFGALSNLNTSAYSDPTDVGKTLYVASGGGLTLTRPTDEGVLIQNIARIARIHGSNGRLLVLGPARTNDVPNSISAYKLDIDNIRIDGNTLSSTNSNGNIVLAPNGSGDVQIDSDTLRVGDANATATVTSNGTGNLVLNTNSGTNSGSVTIAQGSNGNITIEPNGSGDVYINADTLRIGDSNTNTTLTTNGTGDLILNTNSGTNSGSITIEDGSNNDIIIAPNGAGQIILGKQNNASDPQELSYANGRFTSDGDARFSSYVLMRTTSSSGWNSLYLDYPTNSDSDITVNSTTATFTIHISLRNNSGNDGSGFIIRGCVNQISGVVSLVGSPIIESFVGANFTTANVQILTSGSGLTIQVDQGTYSFGPGTTTYWIANVQMSRVNF